MRKAEDQRVRDIVTIRYSVSYSDVWICVGGGRGGWWMYGYLSVNILWHSCMVFMGVVLSEPCVLLNIVSITMDTCVCSLCYTFSLIQLKFSEHLVYVDEILYPMGGVWFRTDNRYPTFRWTDHVGKEMNDKGIQKPCGLFDETEILHFPSLFHHFFVFPHVCKWLLRGCLPRLLSADYFIPG